nr:MAG TPA: hypothetical protein [Caudoviricetes sp.]
MSLVITIWRAKWRAWSFAALFVPTVYNAR